MSGNIYAQKFIEQENPLKGRAWHKLGEVNTGDRITAVQALDRVGKIEVELVPLTIEVNGAKMDTGFNAVLRHPTAEDSEYRIFGEPVRDYELIVPLSAAKMADKATKKTGIETLGFIGQNGERMFITYTLPTFEVGGEAIETYLMLDNPMSAGNACGAYITNVRVVCENTLRAGIARATNAYSIPHTPGVAKLLSEWMARQWNEAHETVNVLKEAYEFMTTKKIEVPTLKMICEDVYPLPAPFDADRPRVTPINIAEQWHEQLVKMQEGKRATVLELFQGASKTLNTEASQGTVWGAWNAFTELETHRRSSGKNPEASAAVSLMNGQRANAIKDSFNLLTAYARKA